jgi:urease accessory protein
MVMIIRMTTTTITTDMVITTTATTMSDKRKSAPLVKGRVVRKMSPSVPPAPQEGSEQAVERGEAAALYRLMAWLSPSFPVGAFSYSSGIEWAVEAGDICDAATLADWLSLMMSDGAGYCDAVLFVHTHRAIRGDEAAALCAVAELAAAFSPSKERHLETTAQGRAFRDAIRGAWPCDAIETLDAVWDGPIAYPVAVGATCAGHDIAVETALPAFLHAVAANWISAGVRLIPLGQTDGQRVLGALEDVIAATAARALDASLDDIGGAALRADLASMRHETQYTRLFRS